MTSAEFVAYLFQSALLSFSTVFHHLLSGLLDHPREARDISNFLQGFAFPTLAAAVNTDGLLCATCHGWQCSLQPFQ